MATASESKIFAVGSEELRGPCCTSCSDNGDTSTAGHYCVDCEIYLCAKCLKYHNKFPATKSHRVDGVEYSDRAEKTKPKQHRGRKPSQKPRCHVHHGEIVDSYCIGHEELCCRICALINHRACKVEYIAVLAKDFKSNPKVKQCAYSLSNMLTDLNQELDVRMNNLLSIEQDKIVMIEKLDKLEEAIIATVTHLAETSRKEVRDKYEGHKDALEADVEVLKAAVATTSNSIYRIAMSEDDRLFTEVETGKILLKESEHLLQTMSSEWSKREVMFKLDEELMTYFDGRRSFGKTEEPATVHGYKATPYKTITYRNKQLVYGVCIVESGDIFITDTDHSALKRYNTDLVFKERINTTAHPVAVCRVSADKIAVKSFGGLVQIISLRDTAKIERYFEVEAGSYGLTYDAIDEEFYSCEKTKITVYNKDGRKLRTLKTTSTGEMLFADCRNIDIDTETKNLFVTDSKKGLIVLYGSGNVKSTFAGLCVTHPNAFCKLPRDIYLVSKRSFKDLLLVNKHGQALNTMPIYNYCVECAAYDRVRNRLVVAGEFSVKAYTLVPYLG